MWTSTGAPAQQPGGGLGADVTLCWVLLSKQVLLLKPCGQKLPSLGWSSAKSAVLWQSFGIP